ncbi:MAG: DUF1573 domain-containing protein [Bacteroidota bacterium]
MNQLTKITNLFLLVALVAFTSCAQKNVAPVVEQQISEVAPKKVSKSGMTFDNTKIDIGTIKKGETKEIEYTFTNTGEEDLAISQVSTCDCTEVLKRPYLPVKPGATGTIKVKFDSSKKDDEEPVEIDIWLEKEDPKTGMPVLERIEYIFKFES